MPLKKGKSKKTQETNFHELRQGKTYAHTAEKFGKKRANSQMVAIVMNEAGMSRKKDPRKRKFY